MMKKALLPMIAFVLAVFILPGCALLQSKTVQVKKTIKANGYSVGKDTMRDGFPRYKAYWIVYSDRETNAGRTSPTNEMPLKKMDFMDAACVVQEKDNYVKLIQYSPDPDLNEAKGKVPRKSAKIIGWIKKDRLLLWSVSLSNINNGFAVKAVIHTGGAAIANNRQFMTGDSLNLYASSALKSPNGKHVATGTIVYLYKQSEDGKSILVGSESFVTAETAKQSMLGWITKDAIAVWGTHSAFNFQAGRLDSSGIYATAKEARLKDSIAPLLPANDLQGRSSFENIFPVRNQYPYSSSALRTGFFDNVLDFTKNSVYNVLGNKIDYTAYKNVLRAAGKVNIVFVADVSANNRNYFPYIKSVIQDLQLYLDTGTRAKSIRFGAVSYAQQKCAGDAIGNTLALTASLGDVEQYFENKFSKSNCGEDGSYQPLFRGITDACTLLQPVKNETNLIVLIGTTGNGEASGNYTLGQAVNRLSVVGARLLVFQTMSKSSNAYNDFILDAEKMMTGSAANIAELKKEKLVDINDVLYAPSYNLRMADSGVYCLDFPKQSMTQGFVLFPKKGEIMPAGMLRQYIDTLIRQVVTDDYVVSRKLEDYFKVVGSKATSFKPAYTTYLEQAGIKPDALRQFTSSKNTFYIPGYTAATPGSTKKQDVAYGVLLNEAEFEKQMDLFYSIFSRTAAGESFKKKRAYRRYKALLQKYVKQNSIRPELKMKNMTLARALYTCTGYISQDSAYNTTMLRQLKKLDDKKVLDIFNRFKYAADAMQEQKNTGSVKFTNNDKAYYWITGSMTPATVVAKKEEE